MPQFRIREAFELHGRPAVAVVKATTVIIDTPGGSS